MRLFILYDALSGKINSVHLAQEPPVISGEYALLDCAPEPEILGNSVDFYVKEGSLLKRPVPSIQVVGNSLIGIPLNSLITIEGVAYAVQAGNVDLEFNAPGEYPVTVSCWPYLDFETVIQAGG